MAQGLAHSQNIYFTLTFVTKVWWFGRVLIGHVLAHAANGLASHQWHVMIRVTLAASTSTWQKDWALVWQCLKICLVFFIPAQICQIIDE